MFQSFDAFKGLEVLKPSCCGGGAEITKRSIKYSSGDGSIGIILCASPSRDETIIITFLILYSPRCAGAIRAENVVIKSEGCLVCTEVHICFGSGGHRAYM